MRLLLIAAAALSLAACATVPNKMDLPSRAELESIAASPAPQVPFASKAQLPDDWRLTGPMPARIGEGAHPTDNVWERAFTESLASAQPQPATRASAAMACVAREAGLFLRAKGEVPSTALLDFIGGRCGATGQVRLRSFTGTAKGSFSDDDLLQRWRSSLDQLLSAAHSAHAAEAGIWFGRADENTQLVMAYLVERAHLEPMGRGPDAERRITITGQVFENAEQISVEVTQGEFGYARCEADPNVAPPHFRAHCEVNASDPLAWIEVLSLPKGRLLQAQVARVLVEPSGTPDDGWRRARFVSAELPESAGFNPSFLARVNEVRARAGLPPLSLESKQSETANRVAPHYFAAELDETAQAKVEDVIALGMIAGWDVKGGPVRQGSFNSTIVYGSHDSGEVLTEMLTYPSGRRALLNPEARLLAVGKVEPKDPNITALAAMVSTYLLLEPRPLMEESASVINELNRQRAALGLEPAVWVAAPAGVDQKAAQMLTKGRAPSDAAGYLLSEVANATSSAMRGWTITTSDLHQIRFPADFLRAPKLALVLSVGHFKGENPWTQYVIMCATPEMSQVHIEKTVALR